MCKLNIYKDGNFIYGFSEKGRDIVSHIKSSIGNDVKIVGAEQVHGSNISVFDGENLLYSKTDGLITNQLNVVLTVKTADCVPIILFSNEKKIACSLHAGRKSSFEHISDKAIKLMVKRFNVDPLELVAHIGPCIHKCCYEVGEDVAKSLSDDDFVENVLASRHNKKYMLDLVTYNRLDLLRAGLSKDNIKDIGHCTCCMSDKYYSYRKNKDAGRMLSFIVRVK